MNTLRVYGKRTGGDEVLIFGNLVDSPGCISRAKKTAAHHGYKITRAVKVGTIETRYQDTDYTAEFFRA